MQNRYRDQGEHYYHSPRNEVYPYDNNDDFRGYDDDKRSGEYRYGRAREHSQDDDYGYSTGYERSRGYYAPNPSSAQVHTYSEQALKHKGKGPKGYTRADERIKEDVCAALMDDNELDASDIEVSVKKGEVMLEGTVDSRQAKRRAEQCADMCSGIVDVQNNLKINTSENTPEKSRSSR